MEKEEMTRLVIDAQAGDADAMEKLLIEVHPSVSYQCRKLLRDYPSDAEDLIQDVLLTVYTKIGTLKMPETFKSWVNRIAVNTCMNVLNAKREFQFAETEDGHSAMDDLEELDQQRIPDAAIDNEETARMVQALIDRLPDSQRITVYLFYYDGLPVKQIAQLMETTENTVKSRLNYARKAIKEGVLDYERKDGVKLYGLSPLPFLLYFLRRCAENGADPAAALETVHTVVSLGAGKHIAGGKVTRPRNGGAGSAGKTAAKAAGKASQAAGGAAAKITAGVVAAAVAIGGAAYYVSGAVGRTAPEPEDTQAYTAQETGAGLAETIAETAETAPVEETYTILRTDIDTSAYNTDSFTCEIFLETPEFSGSAKGYPKINAFFEEMRNDFLSGEDEGVTFLLERVEEGFTEDYAGFSYTNTCTVRSQTEQLVSVTITSSSFSGGAHPELTMVGYTFDAQTGELLEMTDLVGCTEQDILNRISARYSAEGFADPYFTYYYNEFTCYVEDDQVWITSKEQRGNASYRPPIAWPDGIRYGSDKQDGDAPSYTIVRTEVDTSAYSTDSFPVEIYLETPVFSGTAKGYPHINDFFENLRNEFLTREEGSIETTIERIHNALYPWDNYIDAGICTVQSQTDQFVSVMIKSEPAMWNDVVTIDSYTFDVQTGDLLKLTDLLGGTEQEILEHIFAAYVAAGVQEFSQYNVSDFNLDVFAFYVSENQVWVELSLGNAMYAPAIALPDAITYVSGG